MQLNEALNNQKGFGDSSNNIFRQITNEMRLVNKFKLIRYNSMCIIIL